MTNSLDVTMDHEIDIIVGVFLRNVYSPLNDWHKSNTSDKTKILLTIRCKQPEDGWKMSCLSKVYNCSEFIEDYYIKPGGTETEFIFILRYVVLESPYNGKKRKF